MTDERRGEIALALVELQIMKNGIPSPRRLNQMVSELAGETEIPAGDIREFYRSLWPRLYGRTFGFSQVSIKGSA